jgi:hypothetical protein
MAGSGCGEDWPHAARASIGTSTHPVERCAMSSGRPGQMPSPPS